MMQLRNNLEGILSSFSIIKKIKAKFKCIFTQTHKCTGLDNILNHLLVSLLCSCLLLQEDLLSQVKPILKSYYSYTYTLKKRRFSYLFLMHFYRKVDLWKATQKLFKNLKVNFFLRLITHQKTAKKYQWHK